MKTLFNRKVLNHFTIVVLIVLLILNSIALYAQKSDTTSHTYFSNKHHKAKTKYSLYLVFQMSSFLKPVYKVCFNPRTSKYDTIALATHDIVHDSTNPSHIFHYHEMGQFVHLSSVKPQSILLLDENHKIIAIDIIKSKEVKKLAEMYATPLPDDLKGYKVRYYKLTGIPVHGVGDVKHVEIENPMIRMSCHDKKKFYHDHGINGQHAMVGF
ncbi:MAG: hypothetical protein ACKVOU_14155 [Cytophagales bacterium]